MTDSDVRRIEDKVDGLAIGFARLEGSLAPTLAKFTDRQDEVDGILQDFEKRIRTVERFRLAFPSLALLTFLVAAGTLVFYILTKGH